MLVSEYGGEVPDRFEDLVRLPGVGRKTANVVLAEGFGQARIAVDTHVFRVSHRIGLVPDSCKTPLSVERMLTKYLPKEIIPLAHHWLILHGRYVCRARAPKCGECGIQHICARKFGEFKK
jgi:endonuclease-3